MDCLLLLIRHAMCCKKQKHATLEGAHNAYRETVIRKKDEDHNDAYYCVFCNYFHHGRKRSRGKDAWWRKPEVLERLLKFGFDDPCPHC